MRNSAAASLLVAARVGLRHPRRRNQAIARLLLERAAEHDRLTPAQREACRKLADDLDIERQEPAPVRERPSAARPTPTDRGEQRRQRCVAALVFPDEPKGLTA